MSTKQASEITPGGSVAFWNGPVAGFRAIPLAFAEATSFQRTVNPTTRTEIRGQAISTKALEAQRQVDRLNAVKTQQQSNVDASTARFSVANSIGMISQMVSGPIPIPVAGRGEDGGASLFFDEPGFYGDIEINGSTVEYFIKLDSGAEVFDSEQVTGSRLPPKLLGHLFRNFARSK